MILEHVRVIRMHEEAGIHVLTFNALGKTSRFIKMLSIIIHYVIMHTAYDRGFSNEMKLWTV